MPVIEHALAEQKCVAVPRVVLLDGERGSGKMVFCRIISLDDCVKGTYGILEPKKDCQVVRADENSLILVPGCAFTRDGLRMGYGGGYYDRYLPRMNCPTMVLCRSRLVTEDIPVEDHDVLMTYLVTEKGITLCQASGLSGVSRRPNLYHACSTPHFLPARLVRARLLFSYSCRLVSSKFFNIMSFPPLTEHKNHLKIFKKSVKFL